MDEDAALPEVVHLELFRGVLALDRARLHAVELNCRLGQVHTRDAGPEPAEDDGFDEVQIRAVGVERFVRWFGRLWHEAERGEGREEVQS